MRYTIGIGLLLFCCIRPADSSAQPSPVHTRSVVIEYFGEQATALLPTIISDSSSAAELGQQEEFKDTKLFVPDTYVLDPQLLIRLMSEVRRIPTREIEEKHPYVVFHVVLLEDGHREVKILDGDQTFGLLEGFKNMCGRGSLFDHLVYVQKVIEVYKGKDHTT
jgi:hypothetical protein